MIFPNRSLEQVRDPSLDLDLLGSRRVTGQALGQLDAGRRVWRNGTVEVLGCVFASEQTVLGCEDGEVGWSYVTHFFELRFVWVGLFKRVWVVESRVDLKVFALVLDDGGEGDQLL